MSCQYWCPPALSISGIYPTSFISHPYTLPGKSLLGFSTGLLPSNCPGSFWITPTAERGPPTKTQPEDNLGLGKIWLVIYQGLFT